MSLDKVKTNREKLLKKIKANREKHRSIFLDTVSAYHIAMAQYIASESELLEECLENNKIYKAGEAPKPPIHYLSAYDSSISMLEWSEEDYVTIDQREFNNLVEDNWQWKEQFSSFAKGYDSFSGVDVGSVFGNMRRVKSKMYKMGECTPAPMKFNDLKE